MRGLLLDANNDIVICKKDNVEEKGKQIQIASDVELLTQKLLIALGTNKKEWFWNADLGINFDAIIRKNAKQEMIRTQIEDGIKQVDNRFYLSAFTVDIDKRTRTADINFTIAINGENLIKVEKVYGAETSVDYKQRLETANAKITVYENALQRLANRQLSI